MKPLTTIATLAAAALALAACTATATAQRDAPTTTQHNQDDRATLTVTGEATVSVAPDRAIVRLGAFAEAEDADEAQSQVNETVADITAAIRALEIEGVTIQTQNLSLAPRYGDRRDRSGDRQITGYRANLTIAVTVDTIDRAGDIVDAALDEGANTLQGISFTLRDDAEATRDALRQAVQDARTKAEAIAGALGQPLANLLEARETTAQPSRPIPMQGRAMMEMSSAAAPTPIETGELDVSASIQLTYRLTD
jgi:hypothetical protein